MSRHLKPRRRPPNPWKDRAIITAVTAALLIVLVLILRPSAPPHPAPTPRPPTFTPTIFRPPTAILPTATPLLPTWTPMPRSTIYTVEAGDTLLAIAYRFEVSPGVLMAANRDVLDDPNVLNIGMRLEIPPFDGVYYVTQGGQTIAEIAEIHGVLSEDILDSAFNRITNGTPETILPPGIRLAIPGGMPNMAPRFTEAESGYVTDNTGEKDHGRMAIMEGDTLPAGIRWRTDLTPGHPGACGLVDVAGGLSVGEPARPIARAYEICGVFHSGHSGIDLCTPEGTPVLAVDGGTVVFAGWNTWGYGMMVIIDHANGWLSAYAHLSEIAVTCGQDVWRGTPIGTIGSTGNSIAPHLHFEMRSWGSMTNPEDQIAFR